MSETPENRLRSLGLALPEISKPAGNLLGFKIDRGRILVSGQLPLEKGRPRYVGKAGQAISRGEGAEAARLAGPNAIARLSLATEGRLSRICDIVKVSGFVNCVPDVVEVSAIIEGASDLFVAVFGDRGRHAHFAVGVASLPRGVPVEIEVIARLSDGG